MAAEPEPEEDFASLRDSFSALRQSIQQELRRTAEYGAPPAAQPGPALPPAPPVLPGAAPPDQSDDAVGGQFYTLREKLLGGAGYSACSKRPHGDSATLLTTLPPGQQLPPGMIATVRESPAELGRPEEGQPPPPPAVIEQTAADTVVLNAPKPGRAGGPSLLTANDLMPGLVSAPARSQGAKQYMRTEQASHARGDQTASVRAETPRSTDRPEGAAGLNYLSDGVVFGHLAMKAALESHRRHYAEARAALRPEGAGKLQAALPASTSSALSGSRKPTEPRGPILATASRSRIGASARSPGVDGDSSLPAGCEYSAAMGSSTAASQSVLLQQQQLSNLRERVGAQQRAASAGSLAPRSARAPTSAKKVPIIRSQCVSAR